MKYTAYNAALGLSRNDEDPILPMKKAERYIFSIGRDLRLLPPRDTTCRRTGLGRLPSGRVHRLLKSDETPAEAQQL